MSVALYDPIKVGYSDKKSQIESMKKYGYYRDGSLSNGNEQVYYNPSSKKLLVNVTGTHNITDIGTDAYLAVGKLKDTDRYKEAKQVLDKSKRKYGIDATLTGHSLGSGIINGISSKNDKAIGLDGGFTIGQKARSNVTNYRTQGDIVSLFSPSKNSKTLKNSYLKTGNFLIDAYNAHNVNNIKNKNIYV